MLCAGPEVSLGQWEGFTVICRRPDSMLVLGIVSTVNDRRHWYEDVATWFERGSVGPDLSFQIQERSQARAVKLQVH